MEFMKPLTLFKEKIKLSDLNRIDIKSFFISFLYYNKYKFYKLKLI